MHTQYSTVFFLTEEDRPLYLVNIAEIFKRLVINQDGKSGLLKIREILQKKSGMTQEGKDRKNA